MTISVQNTALSSTFEFWRNRTNELATAMSSQAVTTDGGTLTSTTATGNAAITGTFVANVLVSNTATINALSSNSAAISIITGNTATVNTIIASNTISVGNSTVNAAINSSSFSVSNSSVSLSISKPTAAQISDGSYFLNANGSWSPVAQPYIPFANGQVTTTGTSAQLIDYYDVTVYQAVEYSVYATDNVANNKQSSKMLTLYYGSTTVPITEYGVIVSNNSVGTFSANANSTNVRLYFTPTTTSATLKYVKVTV